MTKERKSLRASKRWQMLSIEEKRKKWRKSYEARVKRFKNDPIYAARLREKDRLQKQKQREKRKDEINAKQRENYAKGGEARKRSINEGKRRRDPTIGIASLVHAVRRGDVGADRLIERTLAAIDECGALIRRRAGEGLSERRSVEHDGESE